MANSQFPERKLSSICQRLLEAKTISHAGSSVLTCSLVTQYQTFFLTRTRDQIQLIGIRCLSYGSPPNSTRHLFPRLHIMDWCRCTILLSPPNLPYLLLIPFRIEKKRPFFPSDHQPDFQALKQLDQRCEAADPPIAPHICSTALLLVFSAGLHHLLLCSTTCIIPSIPVMNAPVHCMPVTVSGFLGGKLQTSPFLERFSRVAFLETTGHNPSSLLLSGCSLTLPSQIHRILVPCSLSVFTSCSASSSN